MKIRLDAALHRDLVRVARKSLRSVSKQVIVYIKQGIEIEREEARKAGGAA